MNKYITTRKVTPEECWWLSDNVWEGTVVFEYGLPTYGCVTDTGTAVSMDDHNQGSFFELPNDALKPFKLCLIDECDCGK